MALHLKVTISIAVLASALFQASFANPFHDDENCARNSKQIHVSRCQNKFGHKALKAEVMIEAPANLVWEAIRDNRLADPDVQYSKFTRISEKERLLEQKYVSIPVFGATTCLLKLEEDKNKRIDYNLVKSDRLREFEGSWILTSSEDNLSTKLELSNHVRINLPIPQRLIDAFAEPKMKARLSWVKQLAESKKRSQIASSQ